MNLDRIKISCDMDRAFEFTKWSLEIPWIKFPGHWIIRVLPSMTFAIARFRVSINGMKYSVSVYLDGYNLLGVYGYPKAVPYWEVYPYNENEATFRCGMNETDKLLEAIEEGLKLID